MPDQSLDYVRANAEVWQARRTDQLELAERAWAQAEPTWGQFGIPESEVGLLPARLDGIDVVELGCGTAYVSAWLARRGARPVAIDPTPGQLAIAAELPGPPRAVLPADPGRGRVGAAARRQLRPGHQRVRRRHLGRPLPVDPRGGPAAAARRRADLPGQQLAAHAVRARRGRGAGHRPAAAPPVRHAPLRVARRSVRRVPPGPRRLDRACCAPAGSRSRRSSSCARRRTRPPTTASSRSTGLVAGRPRRCGELRRTDQPGPGPSGR